MDLLTIQKDYDTDDKCFSYLYKTRWKHGFRCPKCNGDEKWVVGKHKYKCKSCGYQTTVLSGTIFQDTHLPLHEWFKALWYISDKGNNATAAGLQAELGLNSNRTAQSIYKKIAFARVRRFTTKLQGLVEVQRYLIRINNKQFYIAIAAEIQNKKIGFVQAELIDGFQSDEMNLFVRNNIVLGSCIICKSDWKDSSELFVEEYIKTVRAISYSYPYTRKVFQHLNWWLEETHSNADLKKLISDYCSIVNSLKADISFEELIYNAVHKKPKPYTENLYKKMQI